MASLKLILQTHLVIFAIPFVTFALNPQEPKSFCERLLNEKDKSTCLSTTHKTQLDWYAASACNSLVSDQMFLSCLGQVQDGLFNPEALDFCTKSEEDMDQERFACIISLKNKNLSQKDLGSCLKSKDLSGFKSCAESKSQRTPASIKNVFQK